MKKAASYAAFLFGGSVIQKYFVETSFLYEQEV